MSVRGVIGMDSSSLSLGPLGYEMAILVSSRDAQGLTEVKGKPLMPEPV